MRISPSGSINALNRKSLFGVFREVPEASVRTSPQLSGCSALSPSVLEKWRNALADCTTGPAARRGLDAISTEIPPRTTIEELCEQLGIVVRTAPLGRVTAVAHKDGRQFLIVVDPGASEAARPFVIAHELGHHLLTLALRLGLPEAFEEGLCDYFASRVTGSSRSVLSTSSTLSA